MSSDDESQWSGQGPTNEQPASGRQVPPAGTLGQPTAPTEQTTAAFGVPTSAQPTAYGPGAFEPDTGEVRPGAKKAGRAPRFAGALILALVAGGIGGGIGGYVASDRNGSSSSSSVLSSPRVTAQPTANAPAGSVQAVAQKVLPSVVQIESMGNRSGGEGSGILLSSDGLILTNNHVATAGGTGSQLTVTLNDGSRLSARLLGADATSDIAVLKADGRNDLTPIELGTSANLAVGQGVVAIGSPLGLQGTVTQGIVSALNRPVSTAGDSGDQNTVIDAIQTDAAINPGNSGGALVNMDGALIGINTAIASVGGGQSMFGQEEQSGSIGVGFAIPVDQATRIADELQRTGSATHAALGVSVLQRSNADGASISDVTADGAAAKAGIPANVVVTKVDDRIIEDGDALIAAIRSHVPGDTVKITYTDANGSNPKTVEATLGSSTSTGR